MNFLAHAKLSFGHPELLAGNLMGDFVKGMVNAESGNLIHQGVLLHRAIDVFTDSHPIVRNMSLYFKKAYKLYANVLVDVVMDHFLANDENEFANEKDLHEFAGQVYGQLSLYTNHYPARFTMIYESMVKYNWLTHYRHLWGVERSFSHIARKSPAIGDMDVALELFKNSKKELESMYRLFYPEVKQFAFDKMKQIIQHG